MASLLRTIKLVRSSPYYLLSSVIELFRLFIDGFSTFFKSGQMYFQQAQAIESNLYHDDLHYSQSVKQGDV